MKLSKRLPLLLLGFALVAPMFADDPVVTPGFLELLLKKKKNPGPTPGRPRAPQRDTYLPARVENGFLSVDFPEEAESATVTLSTGAFPVFSAGIDRGYPCVELPDLSGDFILNVTFDNGDEYEGEISF